MFDWFPLGLMVFVLMLAGVFAVYAWSVTTLEDGKTHGWFLSWLMWGSWGLFVGLSTFGLVWLVVDVFGGV